MKTIILAGGLGTRLSEETNDKPKPMVLLGDQPIVWHIMSIFASQGFNEFVIAGGYKVEVIQEWAEQLSTSWKIEVLDTGQGNQTGSRIAQAMKHIGYERVFATYGDGLGNVKLDELLKFHLIQSRLMTVTAVRPPARFGVLESSEGVVTHFGEKNQADSGWINGGFFVIEPEVMKIPFSEHSSLEFEILPKLVVEKNLSAFHHEGFWQPMDTIRERNLLRELSQSNLPPWLTF